MQVTTYKSSHAMPKIGKQLLMHHEIEDAISPIINKIFLWMYVKSPSYPTWGHINIYTNITCTY